MQDSKFLIQGNISLKGEVNISGNKNSAGPILAAALLAKEESIIDNVPQIGDVLDQIEILKQMGANIKWLSKNKFKIDPNNINPEKMPFDLFVKMRVSILLIGPLLARFKKLKIPHPGGCKIGKRPISTHLQALKDLGVKIEEKENYYQLEASKKLKGKRVALREFSVTATEILMMLATLVEGKTIIEIAAAEPHVQDLGKFLEKMGVEIRGAGTHTIEIIGKKELKGAEFSLCPDFMEAGTFLIALAITGGQGKIKNVNPGHLTFFLEKIKEIGVNFKTYPNEIVVKPSKKFKAAKIQTLPYPGFPTDLQPQISVLLTQAEGKSIIHEPLYENRFQHFQELKKMEADIEIVNPYQALIFGKKKLVGKKVNSSDIRSGAALVLAGLIAEGETLIENISQIERGHEKIEEKLKKLGAKIKRV